MTTMKELALWVDEDLIDAAEEYARKHDTLLSVPISDFLRGLASIPDGAEPSTARKPGAQGAPDLANRDFSADRPNRLWVADITYIHIWAGFLYLAVVLDAFSRRIVGWSIANHLRTELVLDGLQMAEEQRRPETNSRCSGPGMWGEMQARLSYPAPAGERYEASPGR